MTKQEAIRKIANKLNDMGHPCCRCMDCKTCKEAEEIYDLAKHETTTVRDSMAEFMQSVGH